MLARSRRVLLCRKLLGLLLLHSICVAGIFAQSPNSTSSPKPAPASAETGTTIKLRVNLVQVRVVVRDSKGNPVPGLTREDFQVSDNGKPQVISNFSIETRESRLERSEAAAKTQIRSPELANVPPPILPDRFVMLVLDTGQMDVGDLIRSRETVAKFMSTLSPTDRVALYSTFKGEFTNNFTGNPEKVREALAGISAVPDKETSHIVNGLGQPEDTPGGQATAQDLATASAPGLNFDAVLDAMRILARMPGERVLVLISPGFRGGLDSLDTTDERRLIEKANNSAIVINTLDVRGLYVPDIHAPYTETMGNKQNKQNQSQLGQNLIAQREQSLGLLTLANETGGTCFRDSNDLDAGLKRLGAAPDVYYLLGFTPVNLDGSFHKLKVIVTRLNRFGDPLYDTQARRGYFAPMQGGNPKTLSHDELQDALFSQDEIRDFPFVLQTQYVKKNSGEGQLDILSRLQMKDVPFSLVDGRHVDSVTLATSIFGDNGNFVTGGQKVLDLSLLEPNYQEMVQSGLTTKTSFDLKPGKYIIRQVVRDFENSQMAARNGTAVIPN
jgi:VWFA-related protein